MTSGSSGAASTGVSSGGQTSGNHATGDTTAAPSGTSSGGTTEPGDASSGGATTLDATSSTSGEESSSGDQDTTTTGPAEPTAVYIFHSGEGFNGDLLTAGGMATVRAGIDAICESALPADHVCTDVHAMLTINDADEIRDMPDNYALPQDLPIQSLSGEVIDNDWAELLSGDIDQSLMSAEVFDSAQEYWTGSNGDGSATNVRCQNWTATKGQGPGGFGTSGNAMNTSQSWMLAHSSSCMGTLPLLCLCW